MTILATGGVGFIGYNFVIDWLAATDEKAITTAQYPTAAKLPLNSQLDTQKLRSQLSFDLPNWRDDFQAVARDIVKELQTA